MTRIQTLASRPKRTLGALAVVLAAVGITLGSGANFASSQASAGNAFTTGTLTTSSSLAANQAMFTASNIRPGYADSGTVDIANTGSLSGTFTFTGATTGDAGLASAMTMKIVDCGAWTTGGTPTAPDCVTPVTTLATGPMSNPTAALGTWASGEKHRFKFDVSLPGSVTDNTLQGKTVNATYTWSAAS
jgi:hypothetical protein